MDRSNIMAKTCDIADYVTRNICRKENITVLIDHFDMTCYTNEAQEIFDAEYDRIETLVIKKHKRIS